MTFVFFAVKTTFLTSSINLLIKHYYFYNELIADIVKYIHILFIVIYCTLSIGRTNAQSGELVSNLRFVNYNNENGLPNNNVTAIAQDNEGFLWFGTANGLCRFDGVNFKCFFNNPDDTCSISGNSIFCLLVDRKGILWVGTNKGLNRYNARDNTFTSYQNNPDNKYSLKNNLVTSIYEDENLNIWVGCWDGLSKFNRQMAKFSYYPYPQLQGTQIWDYNVTSCITSDKNGIVWTGTWGGGLHAFNPQTSTYTHYAANPKVQASLTNNKVKCIYVDSLNNLWIACWGGGLNHFNQQSGQFKSIKFFENNPNESYRQINYISSFKSGWLHVATEEGLFIFNTANNRYENYTHNSNNPQSISYKTINTIFSDNHGGVWLATAAKGVDYYHPNFSFFGHIKSEAGKEGSLKDNFIQRLAIMPNNNVLVSTIAGSQIWNIANNTFTNLNFMPNSNYDILYDTDGDIWKSGIDFGFLQKRTGITQIVRSNKEAQNNSGNNYILLYQEKNGMYLFGLLDAIWVYNKKSNSRIYLLPDPKNPNGLKSGASGFITTHNNQLWLWEMNHLIKREKWDTAYFFDKSNNNKVADASRYKFKTYTINNVIIKAVTEGLDHNLYLATENGLVIFYPKSETFKIFDENNGLCNKFVNSILPDNFGNIWLGTNKGLSSFDTQSNTFQNYYKEDGLQGNEFTVAALKLPNGNLAFGGLNGISVFNPANVVQNKLTPKVYIVSLRLFNQVVPVSSNVTKNSSTFSLLVDIKDLKKLKLHYYQNVITFEFAALNYLNPAKNQYAYKLNGFDKDWVYCGNQHNVTYTNLNPGHYTLQVKATNNDGIWCTPAQQARLEIIIMPPFWKTIWFRLLCIAVVVGLVVLYFRYRVRRLQLQKKILEKRVQERTHELLESNKILEKQQQEIIEQAQRIHELDQQKLSFFTNLSHEFRTPLTLILGPSEKMLESEVLENKPGFKYLTRLIHRNALRMLRLINQVLDTSKVDAGKMSLELVEGDVMKHIEDIARSFQFVAKTKNINFKIDLNYIETKSRFDADKIEKIIYNLLSNAFKYTPVNGAITIALGFDDALNFIRVKVSDNGIGINAEKLPHIFERFYQTTSETTTNYGGTGLGLSLTKQLIELHKGTIEVKSTLGVGTEFNITLAVSAELMHEPGILHFANVSAANTVNRALTQMPETDELISDNIGEPGSAKVKNMPLVLVVEDNYDLRHFIVSELYLNYSVIQATNGKEAWELALKNMPDIVVSDVMMPVMDGYELCNNLKTDLKTSHIPVILLTAKSNDESKIKGYETGADSYLSKPFNPRMLISRIQNLLTSRQKLRDMFSAKFLAVEPSGIDTSVLESSSDKAFIEKIAILIETNLLTSELSAPFLAESMNMSQNQLYRKVVALTNLSIIEFINTVRLKKSAQMLVKSGLNITEVAYSCGFKDPAYFSRMFKKQFDLSPTEYVLKYRN